MGASSSSELPWSNGASLSAGREGEPMGEKEERELQSLRDKLFPPGDSKDFLKDKVQFTLIKKDHYNIHNIQAVGPLVRGWAKTMGR